MVYGVVNNGKDFPTCSLAKIEAAKTDTGCPKGSLVATGSITALIGPTTDPSASNPNVAPCKPLLHAYNGGPGKVVFFFVDQAPDHTCARRRDHDRHGRPVPGHDQDRRQESRDQHADPERTCRSRSPGSRAR